MTQSLSCTAPSADPARIRERLAASLQVLDPLHANEDLLVATIDVPFVDPITLWSAMPSSDAWFWAPPGHGSTCAIGTAAELRSEGAQRFSAIRANASELWPRILRRESSVPSIARPRLVGGFSFRPGSAKADGWASFGDARFVLPRWTYAQVDGRAWLSLVVSAQAARRPARSEWSRELDVIGCVLGSQAPARRIAGWRAVGEHHESLASWTQLVERARSDISEGRMQKVVAARSSVIRTNHPIDPALVLRQLLRDNSASTIFGIRIGETTFAGATPETLIRRHGSTIHTEALAGTSNSETSDPDSLLSSAKDRCEQRIVEQDIVGQLEPLCSSMRVPRHPVAHALRQLVHLRTPIEGELKDDVHVLDLVALLHPTPAVGGLPREEAQRWLHAHEPLQRGWYASPIGWFDESGDGAFVVGLRCGLLDGDRAVLYAGAGLVSASEPEAEYAETGWKLQVLGEAIGAAGAHGSR